MSKLVKNTHLAVMVYCTDKIRALGIQIFFLYFFKVSLFLGNELELISWSALFSLLWYFSVFVYISFMQTTSTCSFSLSHNLSFAHSYLLRRRI